MSDKFTSGLATIGKVESMKSLIGGILISIVLLVIGIVFVVKKNYSGGIIMIGAAFVLSGLVYLGYHLTKNNEAFAAFQGANAVTNFFRGK